MDKWMGLWIGGYVCGRVYEEVGVGDFMDRWVVLWMGGGFMDR